jgi:subtilisin family serine protease
MPAHAERVDIGALVDWLARRPSIGEIPLEPSACPQTVAIIDSGIDATHPDLAGWVDAAVGVRKTDAGLTIAELAPGANDLCGHGTACAGIIRALCPTARLLDVRVLDALNMGYGDVMLAGLRWSIERDVDVVNMSLGTRKLRFMAPMLELVREADKNGIIIVAAADNLGQTIYPSAFPSLVSVDIGETDNPLRYFRSRAQRIQYAAYGSGVRVCNLEHSYTTMTGTSFATPHMAGIIATILGKWPGLRYEEVKFVLNFFASR